MTIRSEKSELEQSVRVFERKLQSPASVDDSARREQWKSDLNDAFDHMRAVVEHHRREAHAEIFAKLDSQDVVEPNAVREMRHTDERIAELMEVVKAHLAAFAIGSDEQTDPGDVEEQLLDLVNISQELVASVLAQEQAVTTYIALASSRGESHPS